MSADSICKIIKYVRDNYKRYPEKWGPGPGPEPGSYVRLSPTVDDNGFVKLKYVLGSSTNYSLKLSNDIFQRHLVWLPLTVSYKSREESGKLLTSGFDFSFPGFKSNPEYPAIFNLSVEHCTKSLEREYPEPQFEIEYRLNRINLFRYVQPRTYDYPDTEDETEISDLRIYSCTATGIDGISIHRTYDDFCIRKEVRGPKEEEGKKRRFEWVLRAEYDDNSWEAEWPRHMIYLKAENDNGDQSVAYAAVNSLQDCPEYQITAINECPDIKLPNAERTVYRTHKEIINNETIVKQSLVIQWDDGYESILTQRTYKLNSNNSVTSNLDNLQEFNIDELNTFYNSGIGRVRLGQRKMLNKNTNIQ